MSDTAGSRNDGTVDQLLLEAGVDDDGQLRDALVNLRALGAGVPEPSAEIAALMAGTSAAGPAPTTVLSAAEPAAPSTRPAGRPADELAARRKAKRRVTLTTLSVAASLAAGGAVAAASDQGFRESFTQLNHAVTSFVTGSSAAPTGHDMPQVPAPQPAAPAPQATSGPDAVPAAPAPASAPAGAAPSGVPAHGNTPSHGAATQQPAATEPSLPATVTEDVRKGLEPSSKLPVPVPTEVPLPGKVPDVPLK
ncbi:hypothetical protein OUO20_15285 [Arthrobacter sp. FX8]|jgi:hypothetical protein|uniref:hypothetical protein n=1 Tax=unclassified Arthrobacter TaxID=235627 RepID=UPI001CC60A9F|nr:MULTISPECIES: hypothetical protein [unclassified Arthrobacter]WAJ32481.1 hypothetical protein OUO20_15285 [Arthrobacter sp. FX8]BCW56264.1 hypothetical protein StoSoilB19_36380 [Arthrobacter sp. StoSoilB19]